MSDFDEIPDWYDNEPDCDQDFDPDFAENPPSKKAKSQPVKAPAKKVRKPKKVSKTQDASPERPGPSKATNLTMRDIKSTLKDTFGHDSFRGDIQEDAIRTLCLGQEDAFVCLPTGGGKSLIYQLPALLYPGITLVISPLIALIQDQLKGLLEKNIKAESINSKLTTEERKAIMDDLYSGAPKTKLLYITPEQVQTARYVLNRRKKFFHFIFQIIGFKNWQNG